MKIGHQSLWSLELLRRRRRGDVAERKLISVRECLNSRERTWNPEDYVNFFRVEIKKYASCCIFVIHDDE
jgi:hypothetical protein